MQDAPMLTNDIQSIWVFFIAKKWYLFLEGRTIIHTERFYVSNEKFINQNHESGQIILIFKFFLALKTRETERFLLFIDGHYLIDSSTNEKSLWTDGDVSFELVKIARKILWALSMKEWQRFKRPDLSVCLSKSMTFVLLLMTFFSFHLWISNNPLINNWMMSVDIWWKKILLN